MLKRTRTTAPPECVERVGLVGMASRGKDERMEREADGPGQRADQAHAAGRGTAHDTAHDTAAMPDTGTLAEFNALVLANAHTIHGIATALVGALDAEDAAQEAILRAWDSWPQLRDRGAFRAWLLRITINVCRDWQRGRFGTRTRLTAPFPEEEAFTRAFAASGPGGNDHVAALDLRRAINDLEEDLRTIVVLRYYVGMDASQIGALLDAPPATIRTRLRRALALLQSALGPAGQSHPGAQSLANGKNAQGGSHA